MLKLVKPSLRLTKTIAILTKHNSPIPPPPYPHIRPPQLSSSYMYFEKLQFNVELLLFKKKPVLGWLSTFRALLILLYSQLKTLRVTYLSLLKGPHRTTKLQQSSSAALLSLLKETRIQNSNHPMSAPSSSPLEASVPIEAPLTPWSRTT